MTYKAKENPPCNREDCFGNRDGSCMALRNTDFKNGVCLFYKSAKQFEAEAEKYAVWRWR